VSWILFEYFCAFLLFAQCLYAYLGFGPYEEELTDVLDNQKTQEDFLEAQKFQKDVPDNQNPLKTPKDYEEPLGSHPSMF